MEAGAGKAYERVLAYVREEISAGRLALGQRLPPERELAEALQVSRNSVREALRTLEVMGVVESAQGAGNFVSGNFEESLNTWLTMMFLLNRTDTREISQLRQALEMQAAMQAVENLTGDELFELTDLAEALGQSRDEAVSVPLDKKLHQVIIQGSRNPLIVKIWQALSQVMDTFIFQMRRDIHAAHTGNSQTLQKAHEDIVQALCRRDAAAVFQAYQEHFRLIQESMK